MRVRNVEAPIVWINCGLCDSRKRAPSRVVELREIPRHDSAPGPCVICIPCARRIGVAAVKEK